MPIDLYVTDGTFTPAAEAGVLRRLAHCLLHWTDATGDPTFTPNVGAYLHVLPAGRITAGGEAEAVARIDVRLPAVALSTQERRQGFTTDACAIVAEESGQPHYRTRTWVFISNAVDGGWGMGGHAYTNAELDAGGA